MHPPMDLSRLEQQGGGFVALACAPVERGGMFWDKTSGFSFKPELCTL